ncbi:hypothetical protein DB346_00530 [Verrucomicrobia bacterium LW23]|nr:hypothetical protein DB346_00530 [Verrucomicrobia bacterium LW23]
MKSLAFILLMPLAPLLGALAAGVMRPERGRLASSLVTCAAGTSLLAALVGLTMAWTAPGLQPLYVALPWVQAGPLRLEIGFLLDVLSASMASVVALVSFLVMIYARTYMADDPRHGVFFAYLGLFEGAMLGLVLSNSLLQLFMFWELVGLASYLLVGFWHEKPAAAAAARKAFLTTRIGDVALLFGMLLLFGLTGTVAFHQFGGSGLLDVPMLTFLRDGPGGAALSLPWPFADPLAPPPVEGAGVRAGSSTGLSLAGVAMLLIFAGAAGKSGQFPLHVWLPDAMEGPTPVSALIHAATMVAAGIFLMARLAPVLALDATAAAIAGALGAVTMLLGCTLALAQTDLKRVLAFSTVSQLGLMMVAVTCGGTAAAMMHLTTHAFFKALLFLSAGVLIHQMGTQDIRRMGDGGRGEPAMTWLGKAAFLLGLLCLADVPLTFVLAQVTSKEMVLHAVHAQGGPGDTFTSMLTGAMLLGTVLTAMYSMRLALRLDLFSIFTPRRRAKEHASHTPEQALRDAQESAHSSGADTHGRTHGQEHSHARGHAVDRFRLERDLALVAPLAVLALFSLSLLPVLSLTHGLEVWEMAMHHLQNPGLAAAGADTAHAHAHHGPGVLMLLGFSSVAAGLVLGWMVFREKQRAPATATASDGAAGQSGSRATFPRAFAPLEPALRNRLYLDEIYEATLGRVWSAASGVAILLLGVALLAAESVVFAIRLVARFVSTVADRRVLDAWLFDGSCTSLRASGAVTTRAENGYLPGHLRWFVVGLVVIAVALWVSRAR